MKLNINDYMECDTYCFNRSWWLRRSQDSSRRLIRRTLDLVALSGTTDEGYLTERLSADVRRRHPRSLVLVFLLIKFVLPIVIRLVVEWWLRRKGE